MRLRTSEQQRRSFESEFRTQEKYTRASFEASWLIAKNKKPFNIGEELLPAAIKMTAIVHGKKEAGEMRKIPLSNNTVLRRIPTISDDQREQLILRVKGFNFAIQLDESTDITKMVNLLVYFRYIYNNGINEDLLFCQQLDKRTTGMDIFKKVNIFSMRWGCNGRTVLEYVPTELQQ